MTGRRSPVRLPLRISGPPAGGQFGKLRLEPDAQFGDQLRGAWGGLGRCRQRGIRGPAMARTVRDAKLETRTARAALKPSGKPYFRAIDEGLHLGYRKGQTAGKWVVRSYAGEQSYTLETIGTADDTIDPDGMTILSFAQAQAIARQR